MMKTVNFTFPVDLVTLRSIGILGLNLPKAAEKAQYVATEGVGRKNFHGEYVDDGRPVPAGNASVKDVINLLFPITGMQSMTTLVTAPGKGQSKKVELRLNAERNPESGSEGVMEFPELLAALKARPSNDRVGVKVWVNDTPNGPMANIVLFLNPETYPANIRQEIEDNPLELKGEVKGGSLILTLSH
jgi:hypothetical protein